MLKNKRVRVGISSSPAPSLTHPPTLKIVYISVQFPMMSIYLHVYLILSFFSLNLSNSHNQRRVSQELLGVAIKHLTVATSTFLTDSELVSKFFQ